MNTTWLIVKTNYTHTHARARALVSEDSECDLGILFNTNLKFDEHIDITVNNVNRITRLTKKEIYMYG